MLPKFLYGTYKRYKADTTTFVDWLIDTAKKCGYQAVVRGPSAVGDAESGKSRSDVPSRLPNHKISLKELGVLARLIANSTISVSPLVLATARRAIALRKRCAKFFSKGSKPTETSNEAHSHFITVLEEICELLESKSKTDHATSGTRSEPSAADDTNHDAAVLAGNTLMDLSLQDADEPDESQVASLNVAETAIEEEVEEADDDLYSLTFFSIFCLFEDLRNMREFVSQTLSEYLEGKVDLMNLAVVADTAVQLSKQLIEEVVASWPQLQEEQQLQHLVYMTACVWRGEDGEARPDPGVPYNVNMADVAEWCYYPTLSLLHSFSDVLQPGQLPIFKKGHFGFYDPKARREDMNASQRFKEDMIVLLELIPEFAFIQQFNVNLPVRDEITRGLVSFVDKKEVPIWLGFATQILLDVHHGLRYSNHKPFNDLRLAGMRTLKTIKEYQDFSKTFSSKPAFWPNEGDEAIEGVRTDVEAYVSEDALYRFKQATVPKEFEAAGGMEKHFLLKSHSVLCGLMMFNFTMNMQQIGLSLINQWYDIPQLAYLYNMVQQNGFKSLRWPDMDAFITVHGEEHIFVGGRPKTADESIKKLQIATGIRSASDFARGGRSAALRRQPATFGKARLMQPSAAVVNIFQDRYLADGPSKITVDNVEKLLDEIAPGSLVKKKNESASSSLEVLRGRWMNTHRLGALQLLAAIKQGLYAEEPQLQYNYFGMHKRCIEILRRIQAKEDHKFKQYFGQGYMPDDTMISNLVLLVLTVARGSALANQQMGLVPSSVGVGSRIVISCEAILEEYLRANGDKACKELKAFCKNKSLGEARARDPPSKSDTYWTSLEELIDPASMAALQTGIRLS